METKDILSQYQKHKINKYKYIQCKKIYVAEDNTEKIKTLGSERERIYI